MRVGSRLRLGGRRGAAVCILECFGAEPGPSRCPAAARLCVCLLGPVRGPGWRDPGARRTWNVMLAVARASGLTWTPSLASIAWWMPAWGRGAAGGVGWGGVGQGGVGWGGVGPGQKGGAGCERGAATSCPPPLAAAKQVEQNTSPPPQLGTWYLLVGLTRPVINLPPPPNPPTPQPSNPPTPQHPTPHHPSPGRAPGIC
jgi:hypothetical protein